MTEFILDPEVREVSPEEAKSRLEYMGFIEDKWDKIIKERIGSHQTRALIVIARGTRPRSLGKVYQEVRVEEGLPADRRVDQKKQ